MGNNAPFDVEGYKGREEGKGKEGNIIERKEER